MQMLNHVYTVAVVSTDLTFKTQRWFVVTGSIIVHVTSVCVCKSLYHSDPEEQTFVCYCNVNYYLPDKRESKFFRELVGFRNTTSLVTS
jgi:arylamine N-acetyltransferase